MKNRKETQHIPSKRFYLFSTLLISFAIIYKSLRYLNVSPGTTNGTMIILTLFALFSYIIYIVRPRFILHWGISVFFITSIGLLVSVHTSRQQIVEVEEPILFIEETSASFGNESIDCSDRPENFAAPQFSAHSGFYDKPFDLTIEALEGEAIYFTLDGSFPDPDNLAGGTFVYYAPIHIIDRTGEPLKLAKIDTTALGKTPYFSEESHMRRFAMPDLSDHVIEQGMVVRARTACSLVSTAAYFVGEERIRRNLPVLSLVTDPDNLFSYDNGIYVAGRVLDEWIQSGEFNPDSRWRIPTNYAQRGREWERDVTLDFCLPGGECIYHREAGIRLHGRFSRSFPQKSMRLYARNDYGDRRFRADLFPSVMNVPTGHRRLILRNSGNDIRHTMLADGFLQSLMTDFNVGTQAYQPAVVFINGEYWGIQNIRERYDQHYIENVYGVDPDEIDFLNNSGSTDGMPSKLVARWLAWLEGLQDIDPNDQTFVKEIETYIDLESFFDFIIAHVFVGNRDWVSNNVRWWRVSEDSAALGSGVSDGRWRWLVSDFDQWGDGRSGNLEYDNFSDRLATPNAYRNRNGFPFLFHHTTANEELRNRFLNRFADLMNTSLNPRLTLPMLDEAQSRIETEMPLHLARWQPERTIQHWREQIQRLASYLEDRPTYQRKQLVELFELMGTGMLSVSGDAGLGSFKINSITIPPSALDMDGNWAGVYFQGVPVLIQANPAEGYRFVGWEGLESDTSEPIIQITMQEGSVHIRPRFIPE